MNSHNNSTDLMIYEALPVEGITLEPERIHQAVQLSSRCATETQQWQTYLNALALLGFEQWLSERAGDLTLSQKHCSTLQPQYANLIDAVCNLQVGEFNLCLLSTGTLTDETVNVPKAAIDLPEYRAHFYVLLQVQEEQEQATIQGFLRYDQLVELQHSSHLQSAPDWNYQLPRSWFNDDSNRLLLYLRCLEPSAISLPATPSSDLAVSTIEAELTALLPQLQVPNRPLWEILTWEQAAAVLTHPELLDWLYRLQTEERSPSMSMASLTNQLSEIIQRLTQQVVNVGLWLRDELDEVAQNFSWVLLPPTFAPATASLRSLNVSTGESPVEEFETIITGLGNTGMEIPPHARAAYRDFNLAEIGLRLYAVTWPLLSPGNVPEWTLLLVLGTQPNTDLPQGIKLQVSDQTNVLVERVLTENSDDTYLYTSVVGTWNEVFLVTISLLQGEALTLPPFAFVP